MKLPGVYFFLCSSPNVKSVQINTRNFVEFNFHRFLSRVIEEELAPLRFWLHLIDLAVWIEDRYEELCRYATRHVFDITVWKLVICTDVDE